MGPGSPPQPRCCVHRRPVPFSPSAGDLRKDVPWKMGDITWVSHGAVLPLYPLLPFQPVSLRGRRVNPSAPYPSCEPKNRHRPCHIVGGGTAGRLQAQDACTLTSAIASAASRARCNSESSFSALALLASPPSLPRQSTSPRSDQMLFGWGQWMGGCVMPRSARYLRCRTRAAGCDQQARSESGRWQADWVCELWHAQRGGRREIRRSAGFSPAARAVADKATERERDRATRWQ